MNKIILFLALIILSSTLFAQVQLSGNQIDYSKPKEYVIADITISGVKYMDNKVLIMLSGLSVGEKVTIPGDDIAKAIKNLWKEELFEGVEVSYTKIVGDQIFLNIDLVEQPKLDKFSFRNVHKSEADDLREKLGIMKGSGINRNLLIRSEGIINKYFIEKGFLNVKTNITEVRDTTHDGNYVTLVFDITKGKKVKIASINFEGNESVSDVILRKQFQETKTFSLYRFWKASKYIESKYKEDLNLLIEGYSALGYRDARLVSDTIRKINSKFIAIDIKVIEGNKYYFGDIKWVGNTKYSSEILSKVLGIKKGEVYDRQKLEKHLYMDMEKGDVHSLYMNQGYLFSNINPVESRVNGDTIDIEIRIYEGKQARVKHVTVKGNSKTHDHVILREIRTKPGQLFNRADIIRTQRELAQLGYFNAETLNVNPKPNPADGTVDIEYIVEETSSDQIEMSLGWGMNALVGTVGVSFNNFSIKGVTKGSEWRPIPAGDGQKLSLRIQSNGIYYQSYSASFTEPWLGGKKPTSLTLSAYSSVQSNGLTKGDVNRAAMIISGVTLGLGKRLQWPDDYFSVYHSLSYQNYRLENYANVLSFKNGSSNNLSYTFAISRNSVDKPIYPTSGSDISTSIQFTPPYSLFNGKNYGGMEDNVKFAWVEYYKWKIGISWFTGIGKHKDNQKLVLFTRAKMGFLGYYNEQIGYPPFERFYLGGDGLSGYSMDGRELVGMRGYTNNSLSPPTGATVYSKYTLELRYPISLNPMATVFVLGFLEAGNSWAKLSDYNPFDTHRSAGFGARIYLPMFGLLGLDWAYGFDPIPGYPGMAGNQFHFSMNGSID